MFSQPSKREAVSDDKITEQLRERTLKLFDQAGQNWKMLHDLEKSENARLRTALEKISRNERWSGLQDGEIISDDDHPVYIALDALRVPGPRHVLKRAVDKAALAGPAP